MSMPQDPGFAPQPPKKSKAWIWILVILGVIGVPVIGMFTCCGGVFFVAKKVSQETTALRDLAVEEILTSAECVEKIGSSINPTIPTNMSFNSANGSTVGSCSFIAMGSEGQANVTVEGHKFNDQWQTTTLTVQFDDGTILDLKNPIPLE